MPIPDVFGRSIAPGILAGSLARASAKATYAPQMEAVRVPPSAWRTWQSRAIVWGPIFDRSIAARSDRPMIRWISVPRESVWPVFGHGLRCGGEAGSMTDSHVTRPPARVSRNHGGTSRVTDAVQRTTVPPCCHRTDPAGAWVKPRVTRTGRRWSLGRPSDRIGGTITLHCSNCPRRATDPPALTYYSASAHR